MSKRKVRKSQRNQSKKKFWLAIGIIAIVIIVVGAYTALGQFNSTPQNPSATPTPSSSPSSSPSTNSTSTKVLLETSMGNIIIELRNDKPVTSGNFVKLVQEGKYEGSTFHRTLATFMIQGGKVSGSVASINDEIGTNNHNTKYTVAMAKTSQPNSATSEFFINTVDNSGIVYPDGTKFDETYTVFGTVVEGKDVVDAIAKGSVTADPYTGEMSVPVNPVTIIRATILL